MKKSGFCVYWGMIARQIAISFCLLLPVFAGGFLGRIAKGAGKTDLSHGWKIDESGTRVMRSEDDGKTWRDVSPPSLIAAAKKVDVNAAPAHALTVDSKDGNPAFPKGPPEFVKIAYSMDNRNASITIVIKPPVNGKPAVLLDEHTEDGGRTWWKWPATDGTQGDDVKDYDQPQLFMFGASEGWKQKATEKESAILHTRDGGGHWLDVTPAPLPPVVKKLIAGGEDYLVPQNASFCPLDGRRAWASIVPGGAAMLLEYTADGGKHWRESSLQTNEDAADICFLDETHGFLLATSMPAAGHMDKQVYATDDAGAHWRRMNVPALETGLSYYTTGISFRSATNGWITGTYHGAPDVPVFYTRDGGRTWALQNLPVPADYLGGYGNAYPPVFSGKGKLHGYLPVHLVRHDPPPDHSADVNFETDDGGLTWHLPKSNVKSESEVRDE